MSTETTTIEVRAKGTKIIWCECYNPFQDKKYGEQRRVYNRMGQGKGWRCTVCGKEVK